MGIFIFLFKILKSRLFIGMLIGAALFGVFLEANERTATDAFCESCHVHPHVTTSWKRSTHCDNRSGVTVHCVACHLPPGGIDYFIEKARFGALDLWTFLFGDREGIDWEQKSRLEHAKRHTFKESCLACHRNLFPVTLSREGDEAHLHYTRDPDKLRCINCHLHVGHYDPNAGHANEFAAGAAEEKELFTHAADVTGFVDFTETIPGSSVAFDMAALPGGTFTMGSPPTEECRGQDEGPAHLVSVSPFWIGRAEVTWDEYEEFYRRTAAEGRSSDTPALSAASGARGIDGVTGATPPWGNPGQGWGRGDRPAITMTHHAAMTYCRWLSEATGRKYRLPTEAEWEYACRGGSRTPYFFEGDPEDFSEKGFWNSIFGADTDVIADHVIYVANSNGRTQPPSKVKPNPFGLVNMAGNVAEFCLDRYAADAYAACPSDSPAVDPRGPSRGKSHVVRGGSFKSDAAGVRSAARGFTRTEAWLMTDPQIPKSIWWYSDSCDVGFRVVCEYEEGENR